MDWPRDDEMGSPLTWVGMCLKTMVDQYERELGYRTLMMDIDEEIEWSELCN